MSISGYHIAEAGANPISQLACTLANGFTYVEAYLALFRSDVWWEDMGLDAEAFAEAVRGGARASRDIYL